MSIENQIYITKYGIHAGKVTRFGIGYIIMLSILYVTSRAIHWINIRTADSIALFSFLILCLAFLLFRKSLRRQIYKEVQILFTEEKISIYKTSDSELLYAINWKDIQAYSFYKSYSNQQEGFIEIGIKSSRKTKILPFFDLASDHTQKRSLFTLFSLFANNENRQRQPHHKMIRRPLFIESSMLKTLAITLLIISIAIVIYFLAIGNSKTAIALSFSLVMGIFVCATGMIPVKRSQELFNISQQMETI